MAYGNMPKDLNKATNATETWNRAFNGHYIVRWFENDQN